MSKRPEGNLVLRSVYLPEEIDERLRAIAFVTGRSKGDLIRDILREGLKRLEDDVAQGREDRAQGAD